MQVIKKGFMPDETLIQIENWNDIIEEIPKNATISAITKANKTLEGLYKGQLFTASFDFLSEEDARKAFKALEKGTANLRTYKEYLSEPLYAEAL